MTALLQISSAYTSALPIYNKFVHVYTRRNNVNGNMHMLKDYNKMECVLDKYSTNTYTDTKKKRIFWTSKVVSNKKKKSFPNVWHT